MNPSLAFQFHYNVLPSSIISRFIVRMNAFIHKTVWRSGVVLKSGGNTALVKADTEDRKIYIWVTGDDHTRRDFLSAIRMEFDAIHKTIAKIEATEKVPVPNTNAIVDYEHLLKLERKGIRQYIPEGMDDEINVGNLLSGVESESRRREHGDKITTIYVGGSVSGNIVVGDENVNENIRSVFKSIYRAIDESDHDPIEKQDLVAEVDEIKDEVAKGDQVNETFLSRRLRNLKKMAPDIADVALATLANPAASVGMIVQKIAKKIKDETK